MDYKKYSLENLENWLHDSLSCGEASPHEIYSVIRKVVQDEYNYHKEQSQKCLGVLELMSGHRPVDLDDVLKEREYYEGWDAGTTSNLVCDKDDPSPECKDAWNDFWEKSTQYTEEELDAMCDKAASDEESNKCHEYNVRESEYYNKRDELDAKKDRVVKWQLPVNVDGLTGDCFVEFPDDLLKAANLKEGDQVEWIDQNNGSYLLRKVNVRS